VHAVAVTGEVDGDAEMAVLSIHCPLLTSVSSAAKAKHYNGFLRIIV
jgi:hypothetical protein